MAQKWPRWTLFSQTSLERNIFFWILSKEKKTEIFEPFFCHIWMQHILKSWKPKIYCSTILYRILELYIRWPHQNIKKSTFMINFEKMFFEKKTYLFFSNFHNYSSFLHLSGPIFQIILDELFLLENFEAHRGKL